MEPPVKFVPQPAQAHRCKNGILDTAGRGREVKYLYTGSAKKSSSYTIILQRGPSS